MELRELADDSLVCDSLLEEVLLRAVEGVGEVGFELGGGLLGNRPFELLSVPSGWTRFFLVSRPLGGRFESTGEVRKVLFDELLLPGEVWGLVLLGRGGRDALRKPVFGEDFEC